jgi:hypothetical protein
VPAIDPLVQAKQLWEQGRKHADERQTALAEVVGTGGMGGNGQVRSVPDGPKNLIEPHPRSAEIGDDT